VNSERTSPVARDRLGLWVLGIYILFELAFNARLLDAAGGAASPVELDRIESFGRTVSGVGLGLSCWTLFFRNATHRIPALVGVCLIGIPVAFVVQNALVTHLVNGASQAQRTLAPLLTVTVQSLRTSHAELEGFPFSGEQLNTPEGKTFLAVFPLTGFSAGGDSAQSLATALRRALPRLIELEIEQRIGTADAVYNKSYLPAANKLRDVYNSQYLKASSKAPSEDDAWSRYVDSLDQRGIRMDEASERVRQRVVQELHKTGVPVDDAFVLSDRDAFVDAVHRATKASFRQEITQTIGFDSSLSPGLSWGQFSAHQDVLRVMNQDVHQRMPNLDQKIVIHPNMDASAFFRTVYQPAVRALVRDKLNSVSDRAVQDQALKAVIVPPVALAFSLFFGFLNLLTWICWALNVQGMRAYILKGAMCLAFGLLPLTSTNIVSSTPFFTTMLQWIGNEHGVAGAMSIRWLIHAEPLLTPLTSAAYAVVRLVL